MDIRGDGAREYWGNRATTYGTQYGLNTPTNTLKVRRKVDLMLKQGKLVPGDRVLELGCGTGIYTAELAKRLPGLVSSDLSHEMLKVARDRCPNMIFAVLDARNLELREKSLDAVVTAFMLQHTDIDRCLMEVRRVLVEGGRLVALVPNILNPLHYARARVGVTRSILKENSRSVDLTRWEWKKKLQEHRYTQIRISPVEFTSPYIPSNLAEYAMKASSVLEGIPVIREFAGTLLIAAVKAGE